METSTIKQSIILKANPQAVYDLMMNEARHASLIESSVRIGLNPGDTFEIFDGYCQGKNLELVPGKRIVQEWNFAEDGWPDDHYSICTFELTAINGETRLDFTQTGIPAHKAEALQFGWQEYYWDRMQDHLQEPD